MTEESPSIEAPRPPYISYETFSNFFDKKLASGRVPSRIDPQFLDNYAGSVQPQIISTLKTVGMIDQANKPLPLLRQAVQSQDARLTILREWATAYYSEQIDLAQQDGTASMLWETFAKYRYTGSTLRKAVVFYLALVEDLDLPNSPYFKAPKASPLASARGGKPRAPRAAAPVVDEAAESTLPPEAPADGKQPSEGEKVTIDLGDGGTVSIVVNVRWLSLPDETFTALRKGIRALEALSIPTSPPYNAAADTSTVEEEAASA